VVEVFSSTDTTIGNADDVSRGLAVTDANGSYALGGVPAGFNYYEVFRAPVGYTFTAQNAGTDPTRDSDANSTGVTAIFTVGLGSSRTLDAGLAGAAPWFGFASHIGAEAQDAGQAVATDAAGNVYVTGNFSGTADFDPGPATCNLTSAGGYDVFVAKYSSAGALLWARRLGGVGDDYGKGIAVASDGSVCTTGYFGGTADFDPGPGTFNLTGGGVFLSKLLPPGAPTDVSLSAASVAENQPSGTAVGTFSTTDSETGNVFTYALVSGTGSTDNGSFTIAGNVLKTAAVFNGSVKDRYDIRVRTTDDSGLWFEKAIALFVTAAPMDWAGTVSDHWENGANWRAGIVPGLQTQVRISGAAARQPVLYQNQTVRGLDLAAGGALTFAPGGPKTLVAKGLTIAESGGVPTARLDIGSGAIVIDYTGQANPFGSIQRWVSQACHNGAWDGYGIRSSTAAGNLILYGIAVADNNSPNMLLPYGDGTLYPRFGNITPIAVSPESVLVKLTYRGDVNLDGCVDDNDVSILGLYYDGGAGPGGKACFEGDIFGYDGRIDDNDMSILGLTYGLGVGHPLGGGSPSGAVPVPAVAAIAPAPATLVDEPAALDAAALSLLLSKAAPASAAPVLVAPGMAPPASAAPEADGCGALRTIDSATVDAVPLVFGGGDEVAPSSFEPALAPHAEILDLLALPALAL
jgi:hypothetical protein